MNTQRLDKMCYEYALKRVEDLLPQVGEDMPANDPLAMELAIMSDYVIAYEKEHFPIDRPTAAQLIQLSLEENGMTQKELAKRIINDFVCGRAEPSLKVARMLCSVLGIAPALLLGM